MVVSICTKFHENILDGIKVIERTRFFNRKKFRDLNVDEVVFVSLHIA